jgi:4-amino-4-deoxy-L-arabinose transferase-like glycosyltransferase
VAVFAFSLALRLVIVSHATWHPVGDTRDYHAFAESLLSGRGYQQRYAGETAAYHGLTFHAYRMPGYPVFLALVYGLFGWRPLYAYLANVLCDLVTAVFTLLIGRRLGGRGIGLAA